MKIGIDLRALVEGKRTGVEEYVTEILKAVLKIDKKNQYYLFYNSFKKTNPVIYWKWWENNFANVKVVGWKKPNRLLNFSWGFLGVPKMDRILGGVEVLWQPNLLFNAVSSKVRYVVSCHDFSFVRHPEFFSWEKRLWHRLVRPKKILKRADRIVVPTEATKNDIKRIYNLPLEKVEVIFHGVNLNKGKRDPRGYLLCVATFEPRKNLEGLVRAYKALRERGVKNKLVLAGNKGWKSENLFKLIRELGLEKWIETKIDFCEKDKQKLYEGASVFIYPSFWEGFGLPVIEAMRVGVPVVVSKTPALSQVGGDAVFKIDPYRPDEIAEAVERLLGDERLAQEQIEKGYKSSLNFNWEKAARNLLRVFTSL
jgi:glycosyltransferase involved in cell wall biosynthesis